jgi:hypothetical protein
MSGIKISARGNGRDCEDFAGAHLQQKLGSAWVPITYASLFERNRMP